MKERIGFLRGFSRVVILALIIILIGQTVGVYASIQDSQLAKGTIKLFEDLTLLLLILAPIASAALIIYFLIRRGAADEMDQKTWNKRIVVVIVSCVCAVVASATINVILGYYS